MTAAVRDSTAIVEKHLLADVFSDLLGRRAGQALAFATPHLGS